MRRSLVSQCLTLDAATGTASTNPPLPSPVYFRIIHDLKFWNGEEIWFSNDRICAVYCRGLIEKVDAHQSYFNSTLFGECAWDFYGRRGAEYPVQMKVKTSQSFESQYFF